MDSNKQHCFEGTAEELKETKNTQPCLFAMELLALLVDRRGGFVSSEEAIGADRKNDALLHRCKRQADHPEKAISGAGCDAAQASE